MSTTAPDLFTALELQAAGMALADEAEPQAWKDAADAAIRQLAACGVHFSAEDVRDRCGDPRHPSAFGPRLQAASRAGLIRTVGYTVGQRPASRGRMLRLYVGCAA